MINTLEGKIVRLLKSPNTDDKKVACMLAIKHISEDRFKEITKNINIDADRGPWRGSETFYYFVIGKSIYLITDNTLQCATSHPYQFDSMLNGLKAYKWINILDG